jgi:hypothetical protein
MLAIIKVVALEKKKLIEIIGSIFVALIFLSSYAAFGGISGPPNSNVTTTVAQQQAIYASARGIVNITSFTDVLNVNINCTNITSVSTIIDGALAAMEKNGTVSNFYSQQAAQILVEAGTLNSSNIFKTLSTDIDGSTSCTSFESSANIRLPGSMNFFVPGQKGNGYTVPIPSGLRTYTLPLTLTNNMSNRLNVTVSGLLTENGSIYGSLVVQQV